MLVYVILGWIGITAVGTLIYVKPVKTQKKVRYYNCRTNLKKFKKLDENR